MNEKPPYPENLPSAPGAHFRYLRAGDAEALAAVHEGRREHDKIDPLSTFEHVPSVDQVAAWIDRKVAAANLDTVLVAEVGGDVVGYTWLDWWTEIDGVRLFLSQAALLPAWRGRGIGSAMLHWAEKTLRNTASLQPETGTPFFGANATETEIEATALLTGAGYTPVFTLTEMGTDRLEMVAVPPLPAGLVLRPLKEPHLIEVGRSITESYTESAFAVDYPADHDQKKAEWLHTFEPSLCFVAWDGDEVAGQVICRIEKGRGEAAEVSVRKPWRRKGLAKALLARGLCAFRERGLTTARLHTRVENEYGSVSLYESLGFRRLKNHVRYRKPMSLD